MALTKKISKHNKMFMFLFLLVRDVICESLPMCSSYFFKAGTFGQVGCLCNQTFSKISCVTGNGFYRLDNQIISGGYTVCFSNASGYFAGRTISGFAESCGQVVGFCDPSLENPKVACCNVTGCSVCAPFNNCSTTLANTFVNSTPINTFSSTPISESTKTTTTTTSFNTDSTTTPTPTATTTTAMTLTTNTNTTTTNTATTPIITTPISIEISLMPRTDQTFVIVGILLALIAVVALVAFAIFMFIKRKNGSNNKQRYSPPQSANDMIAPAAQYGNVPRSIVNEYSDESLALHEQHYDKGNIVLTGTNYVSLRR